MNKETLTNTEAAKSVDSIDWLAELDKLDLYDLIDYDYDCYSMGITSDGEYFRYEDVKLLIGKIILANSRITHRSQSD